MVLYNATTATKKIFQLNRRIRAVAGGTSASKTISILLWLIDFAQTYETPQTISIVSESLPHLRRGALRDFQHIMRMHNYWDDNAWKESTFTYTFPLGTTIEFFGADTPDKVRGPRRDILFMNEANNIPFETFNQLEVRTRRVVWLDWNPTNEFWFYTDVLPYREQDVDFITLTYRDNESLDPAIVASIESRRHNKNWWRVYGEGLLGEAEGRIYTGWQIIDEIPVNARLERYGLDFGYTNDPTAIVAIYYHDGGFILDEIIYQKGMSNKDIADVFAAIERKVIRPDSAEPKSIDELKSYGLSVLPAQKGPGSVLQGIQFVQDQKISVTKSSTNLIREYRNYLWETDDNGKVLNVPMGGNDHALDAVRYGMEKIRAWSNDYDNDIQLVYSRLLSDPF